MNVNQVIETEEGTVKFSGELSQAEADYVIQVGLNVLLRNGALPVTTEYNPDEVVQ